MASPRRVWFSHHPWRRGHRIFHKWDGGNKTGDPEAARADQGLRRLDDSRSLEAVVRDEEVAEHRQNEGMVNTYAVGKHTLDFRDEGAAHDGGDQQARGLPGERSHLRDTQCEYGGEHDGIEEADQQNAP